MYSQINNQILYEKLIIQVTQWLCSSVSKCYSLWQFIVNYVIKQKLNSDLCN